MAKHNMASQLKLLRMERGLSQAALAREAGIGQTTINLLEAGKRQGLNLETVLDIAIALSRHKPVSLDEVVGYNASQYYTQDPEQPATKAEVLALQEGLLDLAKLVQQVRDEQRRADDRRPPASGSQNEQDWRPPTT